MYSDQTRIHSDLYIKSNDELYFFLDQNNDSLSELRVYAGDGSTVCRMEENGNLTCNGTKSAVVKVGEERRRMYGIESSEVWFEDFGSGSLQNGKTVINVDPLFAGTVNLSAGYHVFLTPLGDCKGLYVTSKTVKDFEVHELEGGITNVSFDYRIVAHRAGYEHLRMELDTDLRAEQESE
jgi:hypothetical protein